MKTCLICMLLLMFSNNSYGQHQTCTQVVSEICKEDTSAISQNESCSMPESLSNEDENEISLVTFAINAINDVITWSAVVLAVLTLFVTILDIMVFREVKKDCEKAKKLVAEFQIEIKSIEDRTKALQKKQDLQYLYVSRINKYIYEFSIKIADANETLGSELLHDYHLINLLSVSSNFIDDFNYLKANGTKDDIESIEFIVKHDDNEEKRRMAQETIGYIRGRLFNLKTSKT